MQNTTLISVIIPCYNAERFVEKAVRSILKQTYKNLEVIVIDDCSTDSTGQILKNLALEDSRIIYLRNKHNLKLPETLNKGIRKSKGQYIARMDADDISLPQRLHKQIRFLQDHPEVDIVSANAIYIDDTDRILYPYSRLPLNHHSISNKLYYKSPIVHPLVLAKRSFFVNLNGYNNIAYAEDYELWIRGRLNGNVFANLDEDLLYYRIHDNQMTSSSYNPKNASIIRKFLFKFFFKTYDYKFIFGICIQNKIAYTLISKTHNFRKKFFMGQ